MKNGDKDEGEDQVERLEKLLKKHEMGEIPRIDWLDQLTFRAIEQQSLLSRRSPKKAARAQKANERVSDGHAQEDGRTGLNGAHGISDDEEDERFTLFIDFPRFDFPIVFTDHEYPPASMLSAGRHTPSSSTVTLKPPPAIQISPAGGAISPNDDPMGGRVVKIYDPEAFARDNPAESMHRRLVRSHRTSLLDRDLKPNAKIRDELNVSDQRIRNDCIDSVELELR